MNIEGERVDAGRRKLAVVAAARVETGIDTSLKLSPGATIRPGETVLRDRTG